MATVKAQLEAFKTKKEKFDFLVAHQEKFASEKRAAMKFTDSFGLNYFEKKILSHYQEKAAQSTVTVGPDEKLLIIVANTYNWMDSHGDVHKVGIFTKSIQENQKNIPHLHDHVYQLAAKVAVPQRIYEESIPWTSLGVNIEGSTTVLLVETIVKKSYNEAIYDQYVTKQITQHSVGMRYVNIFLCINDPQYKEQYANWSQYVFGIGNLSTVLEEGYFWAVTEAMLKEVSCVFRGSNELTGVLEDMCDDDEYEENESNEPQGTEDKKKPNKTTSKKDEPTTVTRKHYDPNLI